MKRKTDQALSQFFSELGGLFIFLKTVLYTLGTTRGNTEPILAQMTHILFRTFSTVLMAGLFVGAILVLQFNMMLRQYDAQLFLGGLNTSSVVREIGPLIISFLLAGKIGAFTAAELATMRVTEQIDAIECLGVDPIQYLIVPRFVAIILSSLILLALGLVISIGGAMGVAALFCGINPLQFASSIPRFTSFGTVVSGGLKSLVYGGIVASVSCFKGYTASGGALGVGRAVTWGAVYISLYIVIANFFTSQFIQALEVFLDAFKSVGH
jgi:phospholipid/cholesterol/gamma-HCH transport system permease protein